jgi:hypothetical protein
MTELDVEALPRRVAHVVHALIESSSPYAYGEGFRSVGEVMVYDAEAITPNATNSALLRAMRQYGLVDRAGQGLYFPTNLALDHRRQLEDRFLCETGN